jgi:hypothetical protein
VTDAAGGRRGQLIKESEEKEWIEVNGKNPARGN